MDAVKPWFEKYPLPEGWKYPVVFSDKATVGTVEISLVGLVSEKNGNTLTGSAAQSGVHPFARAYFELLERAIVAEAKENPSQTVFFPASTAPDQWRYSNSNGVALHLNFAEAAKRAKRELLERHLLLSAWYGETVPRRIELRSSALEGLQTIYQLEAYSFGGSADTEVVGIFGFPRNTGPRIYGAGAGADVLEALEHAETEFLQGMGFLWGEEIPRELPRFSPTAQYHQEFYLFPENHVHIRNWLAGKHFKNSTVERTQPSIQFTDLTPAYLRNKLSVVKATSSECYPLVFGISSHLSVSGIPEVHPFS